jgi:amino acid permease
MASESIFEDIELYPREAAEPAGETPKDASTNIFTNFIQSFRPREVTPGDHLEGDTSPLNRALKGRHLQFIAIGGSIGAGLFIGSGKALATGGPAWLLISFSIVGVMLFCVMHALGELAAIYPISGSLFLHKNSE